MSNPLRDVLNLTRALGDATRLRVLLALQRGELCACQITELFGLAPSTMSKHLYLLRQAGLVDSRKNGRWIHYRLPGAQAPVAVREALDWVTKSLADDPSALEDARNLKRILKSDPAELCKRQCRR